MLSPKLVMTTENRLLAVIPIEAGNKVEPDHMQKGLRASEIRSRRLFEAARDGILILDAVTLKITDVNPFKMELSGYSRDEFIGRELWAIGLFSDKEASQAAFRELQESGYIRYEDLPLETRHGALRGKRLTCRSLTSGCR